MSSSRERLSARRKMYLQVAGSIESQLRDAYAHRHDVTGDTIASIAEKIGVHKSVISRRLNGHSNMTIESISDLLWALNQCINIDIFEARPNCNRPTFTSDSDLSSEDYDDGITELDVRLDDDLKTNNKKGRFLELT